MPVFGMEEHKIDGTGFGFSATRIADLGASEYTLVGIVTDVSGSVSSFTQEIEKCVKEVVKACRRSPRADNLLLRIVLFDHSLKEVHGFKPLTECNPDDYNGAIQAGGSTALFDAAVNTVESVVRYGKDLVAQDFQANGIVFVITDGDDNASKMTLTSLKASLADVVKSEALESLVSVLVGVNVDAASGLNNYLDNIAKQAGFTQYVAIDKANEKTLAKLAAFVSKSISSQSSALGSGGPSKSLTF